jgi:hypothetical protein
MICMLILACFAKSILPALFSLIIVPLFAFKFDQNRELRKSASVGIRFDKRKNTSIIGTKAEHILQNNEIIMPGPLFSTAFHKSFFLTLPWDRLENEAMSC